MSALAKPQPRTYGESPNVFEMAAVYTGGIVRDHPFVDGNKRTGFVVGILCLELNGYRFAASEEESARAIMELASGNLDEAGYTAFLRGNSSREKK